MELGRLDEAVAELKRTLELDLLCPCARFSPAVVLWPGRHTRRAIDEARVMIELDPV